jgi:hypothetical protein
MAHDPLLRWEWEGGAPAHPDRPDWDWPDSDGPDSDGRVSEADGASKEDGASKDDGASKGADVEGRDPVRPDRLRSTR